MGIFGGSAQDQVDLDHLKDRVMKLESAVARLQAQLAAAPPPGAAAHASTVAPAEPLWMNEVRALNAQGKKINAIKAYREATGVGLKEAKDAVEALY